MRFPRNISIKRYSTFNTNSLLIHKNTAAKSHSILHTHVAKQLIDRVQDIKREFKSALDIGCGTGHILNELNELYKEDMLEDSNFGKVELDMCDISGITISFLLLHYHLEKQLMQNKYPKLPIKCNRILVDPETLPQKLSTNTIPTPLSLNKYDAITSCLSLHWINDLPGVLSSINKLLRPDGVFIGAMIGGDTLYELRTSLQLADMERHGGVSNHISPMVQVSDVGSLLHGAGYTLLTVDVEDVVVDFPSIFELMMDLNEAGEGNKTTMMNGFVGRDVLVASEAIYRSVYKNDDGSIPATFQIIYMVFLYILVQKLHVYFQYVRLDGNLLQINLNLWREGVVKCH